MRKRCIRCIRMYTHGVGVSKEVVVAGGLAIVRSGGWDRLSLRAVAAEIGVTPMALYRHVPDAKSLRAMVLEAIVGTGPVPMSSGQLNHDLAAWARAFRGHCVTFDGVAGWLLIHWFESPAALAIVEGLLTMADEHGVVEFEAVALTNAVFTFVLMRCEAERTIRSAGAVKRSLNLAGGPAVLPRLSSLARHYSTARFDTHFEYGLDVLIAGALDRAKAPS